MNYPNILAAFYSTPWAILPEKLAQIQAFLRIKAAGGAIAPETVKAAVASRRDDSVQMVGRIALMPVFGTISQRCSMLDEASGGVSTESLGATLDSLVADKQVGKICMVFDSPGGSVSGVAELGDKIRAAAKEKTVLGIADSMAASAAYWLLSQCSEVSCTPGGTVGSIGVIACHDDISEALAEQGVKCTLVTSAPYKSERYPEVPLSAEALAEMQSKVDHYHSMFVAAIAKGRGGGRRKAK